MYAEITSAAFWQREPGEATDWYRQGLMNEVGKLLDQTGQQDDGQQDDGQQVLWHYRKCHVLAEASSLSGNPFTVQDPGDFGCVCVQSERKAKSVDSSVVRFGKQPLAQQIVLDLASYKTGTSTHNYFYVFGHPAMFAVDVDAPYVTRPELFQAITLFCGAFSEELRHRGFSEADCTRALAWMGTYESDAAVSDSQRENDAHLRQKRSAHVHCHVFGPVGASFADFGEFLVFGVLPRLPGYFRTLFDVSIYSDGRAFRALGQCKYHRPGTRGKVLHPRPVMTLSGTIVNLLAGEPDAGHGISRNTLFLMGTAHPAVVHDDALVGMLPPTSKADRSRARSVFNDWKTQEDALHWEAVLQPLVSAALLSVCEGDVSGLTCPKSGERLPAAQLWRTYNKGKLSPVYTTVHTSLGVRESDAQAAKDSHFDLFYSGRTDSVPAPPRLQREHGACVRERIERLSEHPVLVQLPLRLHHETGVFEPEHTAEAFTDRSWLVVHLRVSRQAPGVVYLRRCTPDETVKFGALSEEVRQECFALLPDWAHVTRDVAGLPPLSNYMAPEVQALRRMGLLNTEWTDRDEVRQMIYRAAGLLPSVAYA